MKNIITFLLSCLIIFNFLIKDSYAQQNLTCDNDKYSFYGHCLNIFKLFGQINDTEIAEDKIIPTKIYHASGVVVDESSDPNKLYIVDSGNNRILGFRQFDGDSIPDIIIGQKDGYSGACNRDANNGFYLSPSAKTLCLTDSPEATNIQEQWLRLNFDVDSKGNLFVLDIYNNRILKYNEPLSLDKSNGKGDSVADFVIGQNDMKSNTGTVSSRLVNDTNIFVSYDRNEDHVASRGVSVDFDDNVWVADTFNHRVLRFKPNSKVADLVIGQTNLFSSRNSNCFNENALDALCTPTLAKINPENGKLYIIDERSPTFKARILEYNPPFYNGMNASRVIVPQDMPSSYINSGDKYSFQSTGLEFNKYKEGEYAQGVFWVTEHQSNRVLLLDINGNVIKVIGAPSKDYKGCDYDYMSACYGYETIFKGFNLCWPGGSVGLDSQNNLYVADESFFRIARIQLPYNTLDHNNKTCIPNITQGLFSGINANSVGSINNKTSFGLAVFQGQLLMRDESRYMVWNKYLEKPTIGSMEDFVIGQPNSNTRKYNTQDITARGSNTIDKNDLLWTIEMHGQLMAYQLPLKNGDNRIANDIDLYWDTGEKLNIDPGGIVYDKFRDALWVSDTKNHRVLKVSNYSDYKNKRFTVDMVLGQKSKLGNKCNFNQDDSWTAPGPPTADSLCEPRYLSIDNFGNLYITESNYECHGNNRIVMYESADLYSKELFPPISAKKVFISDSLTQNVKCEYPADTARVPIDIAFTSNNEMILTTDGYILSSSRTTLDSRRSTRVLWYYKNPLKKDSSGNYIQGQKPDARFLLPFGAGGEVVVDDLDNIIVEDQTWNRVLVINFNCDSEILETVNNGILPDKKLCKPMYDLNHDYILNRDDLFLLSSKLFEKSNNNVQYDLNNDSRYNLLNIIKLSTDIQ